MVLDTVCWANDADSSAHLMLSNSNDNSVHRRPQFDFFNTKSVNMNTVNEIRVVSHLSSNGYYGYAPIAALDAANPISMVDNTMHSLEKHQQNQQVFTTENRKRYRCQLSSDNPTDAKRSRCTIDTIEDVQMFDDQPFNQIHVPVSLQPSLPQQYQTQHVEQTNRFEPMMNMSVEDQGHIGNNNNYSTNNNNTSFVYNTTPQSAESTTCAWPTSSAYSGSSQNQRRIVNAADDLSQCDVTQTNNCDSNLIRIEQVPTMPTLAKDATFLRKSMTVPNFSQLTSTSLNNSNVSFEWDSDNQLASLYWHTHGSIHWQQRIE